MMTNFSALHGSRCTVDTVISFRILWGRKNYKLPKTLLYSNSAAFMPVLFLILQQPIIPTDSQTNVPGYLKKNQTNKKLNKLNFPLKKK